MVKNKFTSPYLGASYYPENWPLEQVDEDIALMVDAGMSVVRVGEFAWSCMEPEEGKYDFSWLHRIIEKLGHAGIATIMCTPTCTPPVWFSEKYPEALFMYEFGDRVQHGGRRHMCLNNEIYREYCMKIVTRMAMEFGQNETVIGWQIDNEIYSVGEMERKLKKDARGCCCPVCQGKFISSLKERFVTIKELNNAWGTNLWSQTYQSFEQIPVPKLHTYHHPSLQTAWLKFQEETCIDFVKEQADILHKLAAQPVGTDMMSYGGISYYKMNKNLDIVQMNYYNGVGNTLKAMFWMDVSRPVKNVPFWNTETGVSWTGLNTARSYKVPGFCRVNSWLPVAMGGQTTIYWHWRSHWSGQELMCSGVVSSSGRPQHLIGEVQEVRNGFSAAAGFLSGTRVKKPKIAMHFSSLAWWMYQFQPMVEGFNYIENIYNDFYCPIVQSQLRMDIIDPEAPIDDYQIICSTYLPALDEGGLRPRLLKWIEAGGIWVVGPMTDTRTVNAAKFIHSPFGSMEDWAGVYCKYEIPLHEQDFNLQWQDGTRSIGSLCYCGFEPRGAEVLASYEDGPLCGLAAVTRKKTGKGQIIVLGTTLRAEDIKRFIQTICTELGIQPAADASSNILTVPRNGEAGEGMVVLEIENKEGYIQLEDEMKNILTGEVFKERIHIPPYSVMVLKKLSQI